MGKSQAPSRKNRGFPAFLDLRRAVRYTEENEIREAVMDFAKELVLFSHILEQKGFVNGLEGNISLIDREKGRIYINDY